MDKSTELHPYVYAVNLKVAQQCLQRQLFLDTSFTICFLIALAWSSFRVEKIAEQKLNALRCLNASPIAACLQSTTEFMDKKQTYHHGDLRQALLSAALVLLQTKDMESLSLREVAKQAGVSHTAPYRHFKDKAALLAAVAEEGFITFGQYLTEAVAQAKADPIESLASTGEAYVRYALEHPAHFRVMFKFSSPEYDANSSLEITARGTFQTLVDVVVSGQASGVLKAGDPHAIATGRWALVHGFSMLLLDGMLPQTGEAAIALIRPAIKDSLTGLLSNTAS